jgi:hypothetical protein
LTTVLEKLKALDAQRAQLLEGAKKEALDNAEKAVAELNELGFHYTLSEGASASARAPHKTTSQAPKRQARDLPCPSRWADAPVTKEQKAVQRRRIDGKASGEGWVVSRR